MPLLSGGGKEEYNHKLQHRMHFQVRDYLSDEKVGLTDEKICENPVEICLSIWMCIAADIDGSGNVSVCLV